MIHPSGESINQTFLLANIDRIFWDTDLSCQQKNIWTMDHDFLWILHIHLGYSNFYLDGQSLSRCADDGAADDCRSGPPVVKQSAVMDPSTQPNLWIRGSAAGPSRVRFECPLPHHQQQGQGGPRWSSAIDHSVVTESRGYAIGEETTSDWLR